MRALLEKDIRLILIRKSTIFIFLVIGLVFSFSFSDASSSAYLTVCGLILALSTLSYDDSDNCMEYLLTLPCSRKGYVVEKYIFIYGTALIAGLIGTIIVVISHIMSGTPVESMMLIETIVSIFPVMVFVGGFMIPLQLKFGPEKTRIVLLAVFGVVFLLAFAISSVQSAKNIYESLILALETMTPFVIAIIAVIVAIVLSAVSLIISMRVVEKKEY